MFHLEGVSVPKALGLGPPLDYFGHGLTMGGMEARIHPQDDHNYELTTGLARIECGLHG